MNRMSSVAFRVAAAGIFLWFSVGRTKAQAPPTPPPTQQAEDADDDDNDNPFTPQPAPALPAGMKGSDASDVRASLKPGLYDAGEASMGIKHLLLLKKPDASTRLFSSAWGSSDKRFLVVIAQLAFSNSDLAFSGNHLFRVYGVNVRHLEPCQASLLRWCAPADRVIRPSTRTCCSYRWRCPMAGWIAVRKDSRRRLHRQRTSPRRKPRRRRKRIVFEA